MRAVGDAREERRIDHRRADAEKRAGDEPGHEAVDDNHRHKGNALEEHTARHEPLSSDPIGQGAEYRLPVPEPPLPLLSPLLSVVPGQLFAHALARAKGLDADRPERLTKITLAK